MKLAVQTLRDLTGMSRTKAEHEFKSAGFLFHGETRGGYREFRHPDDSVVWIRPSGEIVRLGTRVVVRSDGKKYRYRYDQNGERTTSHSTGERLSL